MGWGPVGVGNEKTGTASGRRTENKSQTKRKDFFHKEAGVLFL
jgi:hypothetical protein